MNLKLRTALGFQTLPIEMLGYANIAVIRRAGIFMRHFQKDEIGQLLKVVTIADSVVLKNGTEAPDLRYNRCGTHAAALLLIFFLLLSALALTSAVRSSEIEAGSSFGS